MLYPMKRWTLGPSRWGMVIAGLLLFAGGFATALAADSPLVGAWQLDSEHSAQAGLYLFTPTRYSMVLAAADRPDIIQGFGFPEAQRLRCPRALV